jgi:hypothetical protein
MLHMAMLGASIPPVEQSTSTKRPLQSDAAVLSHFRHQLERTNPEMTLEARITEAARKTLDRVTREHSDIGPTFMHTAEHEIPNTNEPEEPQEP